MVILDLDFSTHKVVFYINDYPEETFGAKWFDMSG